MAENQLIGSRLEKLFFNEMESYLKDLPTEAMRQSFKDPMKQLFQTAMKKAKESNMVVGAEERVERGSTMNNIEMQLLREEVRKFWSSSKFSLR